jgi:ubiquinone/menaquinone biosynthesis C-methylase UbiE
MPDTRGLVKQQFSANAEHYVASTDHSQGESLDRMLVLAAPQAGWRVLDIATGGGHTALAFAPHVREVVATDLTPEMLAAAERHIRGLGVTNVIFREADAGALPFDAGEFDLVTCRVAPHHFPDCAQFVREMARVLRPGGMAVLVDNVVPEDIVTARHINAFEKLRDPSHNWAYPAGDWLDFFAAAGLEVVASEIFRKARDFDHWTDMVGVDEKTRTQLRVMLLQAPEPAREALAPEIVGGKLRFYLTEVLVVASKHTEK